MARVREGATPHFKNPPVVETVLGVQFAPLRKMRITHYGLLLPCLRDVFPTGNERLTEVSEQLPLDPVIEIFETNMSQSAALRWSVSKAPPFPRCWYASENKQFLAQVQPDRFIFNWRGARASGHGQGGRREAISGYFTGWPDWPHDARQRRYLCDGALVWRADYSRDLRRPSPQSHEELGPVRSSAAVFARCLHVGGANPH